MQEAELFDKDINSIVKLVTNIEKDYQIERLNENFKHKKQAAAG
jgi:hypothetical protein